MRSSGAGTAPHAEAAAPHAEEREPGTGACRALPAAPTDGTLPPSSLAAGEPRRGFGRANGAVAHDMRSPINAIY